MKQILLLEDDQVLRKGIILSLGDDYLFTECSTIQQAREALQTAVMFDLFLLDIQLPDGSGLDFCQELRTISQTPIIMLTANDSEYDIVTGFGYGADDYITKPFNLSILRARVTAVLRRTSQTPVYYEQNGFSFDFEKMEVKQGNQLIPLSNTEFRLLKLFVSNPNRVLTREQLIDAIWSIDSSFVDENALSVSVNRLRNKLVQDSKKIDLIKTVYGLGYRWEVKP
ncbi:response regulator transcription factor [Enterococcus sp. BWR-S5]|uniref:response regulator transcription factor n=1 Tax=Enterococcus sp. BWR-S5 TaxID=2787714 RepID=UPI00192134AF|nr:response regulator transcription factor [Enterococcus sp. BWR-S5]MBL1225058.1 response regulator transcription factor [Enterococcus sp. BWR-S5]